MPNEEAQVPEYYIDGYGFNGHEYTVFITFTVTTPGEETPKKVAVIRMSPEHAKMMSILFKRAMKDYEGQIGVEIGLPAQLLEKHNIDLNELW